MIVVIYKQSKWLEAKLNSVTFLEQPREWKEFVRYEQSAGRWYAHC